LTSSRKGALLASPALWAYRAFRRTGALDHPWGRKLFLASYFRYKRFVEDPFAGLLAKHAELFRRGHVLDVGANVGYTAAIFAGAVAAPFRVFAFEPEGENFRALSERFARDPRVEPLQLAVGAHDGSAELWINRDHPGDHRILTSGMETSESVPTRVVRIDTFARERGIAGDVGFVKIDVQGQELAVLRGMSGVVEESRPAVALEFAPDALEEGGASLEKLLGFFEERRYAPFRIERHGGLIETDGEALSDVRAGDYRDLLFRPESSRA
jgi:FkbM family methyltransferase